METLEKKTATITASITEAQKKRFTKLTEEQGIASSVLLRMLIQHIMQVDAQEAENFTKQGVEWLLNCYEHLPSSLETFADMRGSKVSTHLTPRQYSDFKELAKKRVRRAGSLLAIIVSLFLEGIIKINLGNHVSGVSGVPTTTGAAGK